MNRVLILSLLLSVFACGDSSTPGDAGPQVDSGSDVPAGQLSLFPLVAGASWTFQITEAGTLVGEKTQRVLELGTHPSVTGPVFILETTKPNGRRTVSYQRLMGNDTVRFLEESFEGDMLIVREVYDPFKLRVSNDMSFVSFMRTDVYNEQSFDAADTLTNEINKTEDWVVEAIESITVPAGTFEQAVRVGRSNIMTGSTKTYWFVNGVGKVREISSGQTEELSAYTIP